MVKRQLSSASLGAFLVLVLGATVAGGCDETGDRRTTVGDLGRDQAVVVEWARTDLGFGRRADCLVPRLVGVGTGGASWAELRRRGMDALPMSSRQRIGEALIVCGIAEGDR